MVDSSTKYPEVDFRGGLDVTLNRAHTSLSHFARRNRVPDQEIRDPATRRPALGSRRKSGANCGARGRQPRRRRVGCWLLRRSGRRREGGDGTRESERGDSSPASAVPLAIFRRPRRLGSARIAALIPFRDDGGRRSRSRDVRAPNGPWLPPFGFGAL